MATSGTWDISWASGTWSGYPKSYHWSGNFNRSSNTIALSNMKLWFTLSGTGYASGVTDSVTITGGSAQTVTWNFSGSSTSNVVSLNNTSFSVSSSATSATIQCAIAGENTGSTTIYFDSAYTAPNTPTISAVATSPTSISITYGTTSFGNPATGTVTLYGGTTSSPTTAIDTYASTGDHTFVYNSLAPETTYYFRARANNGQLNSDYSTEINVTTPIDKALYGSVNGEAKRVTKLYGSVQETVNEYAVTAIANNNSLNVNTFNDAMRVRYFDLITKVPVDFSVVTSGTSGYMALRFSDNSSQILSSWASVSAFRAVCSEWGFTSLTMYSGSVSAAVYRSRTTHTAKQITKLYGSVNGVTKQIF